MKVQAARMRRAQQSWGIESGGGILRRIFAPPAGPVDAGKARKRSCVWGRSPGLLSSTSQQLLGVLGIRGRTAGG